MTFDRRAFLFSAAGLAACGPRLAKPYNGIAYIASQTARTVSVVNLNTFKMSKEIPLDAEPSAVLVNAQRAYAFTPANGSLTEIEAATGTVAAKHKVAVNAVMARMAPDGKSIWILAREPQAIIQFDLQSGRTTRQIKLAKPAQDFDLSSEAPLAAVSSPAHLIHLATGRIERALELDTPSSPIRFRPDGKQVLAANAQARLIEIADVATGRQIVKLPVPLAPQHFCFTLDNGGQMFVTGLGADVVAIVSPYQTAVGETILAGHAPGAMQVDANNLYVANPESGDLTVIAIGERRLLAKIPIGQEPCQILLTPDGQYCLVLNRKSSDMAVVRISKLNDYQRSKAAPIFTVVPLGANPVSGAICSL